MAKKSGVEDKTLPFFVGDVDKKADEAEIGFESAYLHAVSGEYKGQIYMLRRGEMTIGRHPDSDIFLDDGQVSRRHAKIVTDEEKSVIIDNKSTNGTFVNGKKVKRAVLHEGDKIRIGFTTFQYTTANPLEAVSLGLKHHGYFEERLYTEIQRARAYGRNVSLMMISLSFHRDFAKGLSKAEAEKEKQKKYYELVKWLRRRGYVRDIDLMGGYGRFEMEIMLPETSREEVLKTAQRILEEKGHEQGTFISIGVANFPMDGKSKDVLFEKCRKALKQARTLEKNSVSGVQSEEVIPVKVASDEIVVRSEKMIQIFDLAAKIAKSNMSVLIQGETGVGKEVIADTIHKKSDRAANPLIRVNCAALTETILESELFGHEKGSFTGADRLKIGLFESAKGGTIFLDEIGEMPLKTQAKLLRVLQSKKIMRVGGNKEIDIDVRVIAATNRNLEDAIKNGTFREDLYYRLNAITITVPPLRERREEIEPLALSFVKTSCAENKRPMMTIAKDAMEALVAYDWPGNVRELKNCIERAVVITEGNVITRDALSDHILERLPLGGGGKGMSGHESGGEDPTATLVGDVKAMVQEYEKKIIMNALEQVDWNQTKAAELLGIPRRTLVSKIKKLNIKRRR